MHHTTRRTFLNAAAVCALVSMLIGCGSSTSDPAPGLDSRAAATRGPGSKGQGTGQAADSGVSAGGDRSSQSDRPSPDKPAVGAGTTDEGNESPAPNIPATIAKDLASPDARDRYRALDHWEAKDLKAPLDPVFDAMEDDDPAVRAKATAIIEQYWTAEQEREKE